MTRILGLDYGGRRVGAAIGDPERRIATPLEVYLRQAPESDARHYRALVCEQGVTHLVVGLPIRESGREGVSSRKARQWGAWLAEVTGRPVAYFDERYTTREAEERLRDAGLSAAERKARRDMLAAQILLQDYLDAGCPSEPAAHRPIDDPDDPERTEDTP